MASKLVLPQQGRGEGIVAAADKLQQQKIGGVAAGEAKNRRAPLKDIGNQISRRVTRSFGAQLLADAQAAEAMENYKKLVCVNVDKAVLPPVVDKKPVVQKEAAVQPKIEEVIEISPDTSEEGRKVKSLDKKKEQQESSSRKKRQTYSSVLSARSKVACGIESMPKKEVIDIDAGDANNDLAGVEYVEDIYKFYKEVEEESRPRDYMDSQPEINKKMRAILVDWLIEVHHKFELAPETLYLTINIVDRFLSVKKVPRRELQLVGISATLIASKYEEIWAPEVNDLVCISDSAYSHQQILVMEKAILAKLEWNLTLPTHYVFLARFIKASIPNKDLEDLVYFFGELGMMHYEIIMFCPSMVAASAVYAARCTLNESHPWTETLKHYTGYAESQLKDCAAMLVYLHSKSSEGKLRSVHKKYSSPERGSLALLTPAKSLLPNICNSLS